MDPSTWPDWEPLRIDAKRPWFQCDPQLCVEDMHRHASTLAAQLPVPVRVDFYATTRGPVFGEFCVTPGLVIDKRITDEGNALLGRWIEEAMTVV